jgi:hypothetical protein
MTGKRTTGVMAPDVTVNRKEANRKESVRDDKRGNRAPPVAVSGKGTAISRMPEPLADREATGNRSMRTRQ